MIGVLIETAIVLMPLMILNLLVKVKPEWMLDEKEKN
jgi:hypothetical protein